jgi:flavin-dependent dehydrogenase
MAVAIRGYAPTPPSREHAQVIVFGTGRQPAYAWAFDRGDGLSNIGYGELLDARPRPTRAHLLEQVEALLPGSTAGATDWAGHQLPLSHGRTPTQRGPVLLAGDAAGLVNPMTGEGIYYAVATGLSAGRAAAEAIAAGDPGTAGARHARTTKALLGAHLKHIAVAGRLCRSGAVLDAGLDTSASDRGVFDDLVELGLADGRITARLVRGLARELAGRPRGNQRPPHQEGPS